MHTWQLQKAKAQLSLVVKEAIHHGPQEISLHGEPVVVVIAKSEYDKLLQPKQSLVDFMRASPLASTSINLQRDRSLTRKIDL